MAEWSARVQDGSFDVAIIGGGVVGCAAFREFVLAGARCVLVERDADLINGASKGNSGLLHTGFDWLDSDDEPSTLDAEKPTISSSRPSGLAVHVTPGSAAPKMR